MSTGKAGSSRIFVVSNREPYMHIRQGKETVCVVPPSGLVTAIEPVLRACDGVWVALGSGSEDRFNVDDNDRLRVPPQDPRYTLRRVWLSEEEERGYYDGFANEGLWPLCHIAHTRPIFRASDWECYQEVNRKFALALLHEMEGCPNPIVFVQDYHFALLPRMVKAARPDARVAIFWHIPWPNPEAFGICPWQAELLEGLLGADLIGFHIALHCNNFLDTVDRVLESRTDREHMTAGAAAIPPPFAPIPSAWPSTPPEPSAPPGARPATNCCATSAPAPKAWSSASTGWTTPRASRSASTPSSASSKNIRGIASASPWCRLPRPAAPAFASYAELRRRIEAAVDRINSRFQTADWRPVILIERQCNHDEVTTWYRAADVCLVTSLHDGMNLVAKEYLAAREDEDGVLVLSKFTGAAVELRDALIVNPYDIEGVAEAIHRALEMSPSERRLRMQRMRRHIMEHNVYRWAASVLGDLRELRIENQDVICRRASGIHGAHGSDEPERRRA